MTARGIRVVYVVHERSLKRYRINNFKYSNEFTALHRHFGPGDETRVPSDRLLMVIFFVAEHTPTAMNCESLNLTCKSTSVSWRSSLKQNDGRLKYGHKHSLMLGDSKSKQVRTKRVNQSQKTHTGFPTQL